MPSSIVAGLGQWRHLLPFRQIDQVLSITSRVTSIAVIMPFDGAVVNGVTNSLLLPVLCHPLGGKVNQGPLWD